MLTGQVTPGDASAVAVEDSFDDPATVLKRSGSLADVRGQEWFDLLPLLIGAVSVSLLRSHEFSVSARKPRTKETRPRAHIDAYVVWYNTEHRHSGIALFTPNQVHDGSWEEAWNARVKANDEYYARHPERFHAPPQVPKPAGVVGINHEPVLVEVQEITAEAA